MLISHQSSIFDQVRLLLARQLEQTPPSPMPPPPSPPSPLPSPPPPLSLPPSSLLPAGIAKSRCRAAGQPATAAAADHESIMIKSFDSGEVGNGGGGWCILHPVGISIFVHAHFLRKNEKRHCFSWYTTFKLQLLSIFRANTLPSTLASQTNAQLDKNRFEF